MKSKQFLLIRHSPCNVTNNTFMAVLHLTITEVFNGNYNIYVQVSVRVLCLCFVFLCLVYPMLPVSLDSSFLIALSVLSNVYILEFKMDCTFLFYNF
jgi:hypothetical protein